VRAGELYLVDFGAQPHSTYGADHVQYGIRPGLVVHAARYRAPGLSLMVPLSTRVRGLAHRVPVGPEHGGTATGLHQNSEIITEQVCTVPDIRVIRRLGQVPDGVLSDVLTVVHRFIARE
jgi:mRNA-degrading endonuclease toxin of MazEF toxin-antitoxin module